MTVKQKIINLKTENDSLLDSGEFTLDGRTHGILQDSESTKIIVISQSKDDIDEEGRKVIKSVEYENLKSFFDDYPPSY